MEVSLNDLRPYKSVTICRLPGGSEPDGMVKEIAEQLKEIVGEKDLDVQVQVRENSQGDELEIGYFHYKRKKRSAWTLTDEIVDIINHLALIFRRKRLFAFYFLISTTTSP